MKIPIFVMMMKFFCLAFLPPQIVIIFAVSGKYKAIIPQIMNYCNSFLANNQIIPILIEMTASRGQIKAETALLRIYL